MKNCIPLFFILLGLFSNSKAQTFTATNQDGVEIRYTVTTGNYVKVEANNYSGRVVVPNSVEHAGITYTVDQVANRAFASSSVSYLELPSTLEKLGVQAFAQSQMDTLYLKYVGIPGNNFGNEIDEAYVKALFGNNLYKTVCVMVPAGRLRQYYRSAWGIIPGLTAPGAIAVTMYAPRNIQLTVTNRNLKNYNDAGGYFTLPFEIGEKTWIAAYPKDVDTLFLGWDKGDVYLTEITPSTDTLRPVFDRIGLNTLSVNNVSTPIKFNGQMSYLNNVANYYVPATSTLSPLFSNGLWISGETFEDNDYIESFIHATTYNCAADYVPGPLTVDGQPHSDLATRQAFNRVWTVSRDEIDDFIANVGSEGYSIPENILSWPGNGGEGYAEQLAPYYDADSDGVYDPHHGDYPLIRGDRMAFSIFNDVTVAYNTGSSAMGTEIHMSAYAFDEPDDTALNNTVFLSFKIINRSELTLLNSYLGAFTDFDIGYGNDDYVGCDVRNGMAYGYNGFETDQYYNSVPPAQGCIMLAGPTTDPDGQDNPKIDIEKMRIHFPDELASYLLPDGSYDTLHLTADANLYYPDGWYFEPYDNDYWGLNVTQHSSINGMNYGNGIIDDERLGMCKFFSYERNTNSINGEPTSFSDYIAYIEGYFKNFSYVYYGGSGTQQEGLLSTFMFPNDSDPFHWGTSGVVPDINPNNWNEVTGGNAPGDRRGLQSSGPFSFEPGEVNTLDLAYSTAFGSTTAWSSVERLQEQAMSIRRQFARDTTDSGRPFTYRPYSAPIVNIADAPAQPSVKVYPNPAHNNITVALGEGMMTEIVVYDIRGNKVMSVHSTDNLVNMDISDLPNGIYILRCGHNVSRIVKK